MEKTYLTDEHPVYRQFCMRDSGPCVMTQESIEDLVLDEPQYAWAHPAILGVHKFSREEIQNACRAVLSSWKQELDSSKDSARLRFTSMVANAALTVYKDCLIRRTHLE